MTLEKRLDRWAAARDRRNPFGHGKTGTKLLREAAERIRELEAALSWYANSNRYRVGAWPERDDDPTYDGSILPDNGARARAALMDEARLGPMMQRCPNPDCSVRELGEGYRECPVCDWFPLAPVSAPTLRQAVAALRSALLSGEPYSDQLKDLVETALERPS